MKKIVIILPSIQHGGIQRSLLEALNVINTTKYDITVYAYSHYNPLSESLPKDVKVIIDTDKSHYIRKPISIFLHIALFFAKIFRSKKNRQILVRICLFLFIYHSTLVRVSVFFESVIVSVSPFIV